MGANSWLSLHHLFCFFLLSSSTSPSLIKHVLSPPSFFLGFILHVLFPHPTEVGCVEESEWLCDAKLPVKVNQHQQHFWGYLDNMIRFCGHRILCQKHKIIHIKGFFVLLKHTFYEMRLFIPINPTNSQDFYFFQVSPHSLLASLSLAHTQSDRKHYDFSSVSLNKAQESLKPVNRFFKR